MFLLPNISRELDTCCTVKAFSGLVRRARGGFCKPTDNVLFAQDWEVE